MISHICRVQVPLNASGKNASSTGRSPRYWERVTLFPDVDGSEKSGADSPTAGGRIAEVRTRSRESGMGNRESQNGATRATFSSYVRDLRPRAVVSVPAEAMTAGDERAGGWAAQ